MKAENGNVSKVLNVENNKGGKFMNVENRGGRQVTGHPGYLKGFRRAVFLAVIAGFLSSVPAKADGYVPEDYWEYDYDPSPQAEDYVRMGNGNAFIKSGGDITGNITVIYADRQVTVINGQAERLNVEEDVREPEESPQKDGQETEQAKDSENFWKWICCYAMVCVNIAILCIGHIAVSIIHAKRGNKGSSKVDASVDFKEKTLNIHTESKFERTRSDAEAEPGRKRKKA